MNFNFRARFPVSLSPQTDFLYTGSRRGIRIRNRIHIAHIQLRSCCDSSLTPPLGQVCAVTGYLWMDMEAWRTLLATRTSTCRRIRHVPIPMDDDENNGLIEAPFRCRQGQ